MQAIIFHEVIGKRIPALHQIRTGLKLFNVLQMIIDHEELFEPLFVYNEENILSFSQIKAMLQFNFPDNQKIKEFLLRYLEEASVEKMESFLKFCTGSTALPGKKDKG